VKTRVAIGTAAYLFLAGATYGVWSTPYPLPWLNSPQDDTDAEVFKVGYYESALLFASARPGGFGGFDIWYSEFGGPPFDLGVSVNSPYDDKDPAIFHGVNPTSYGIASNRPGGAGGFDLWLVSSDGSTPPTPLAALNSPYDDVDPCLFGTPTTVVFASNRPGGVGGYDLWWSVLENGTWAPPANLGAFVNTAANEISPFVAPRYLELLFASDRLKPSYGGYDIFRTGFEEPHGPVFNEGIPINSPYNEMDPSTDHYFCFYLTSDRPGSIGGLDIRRSGLIPGVYPTSLGRVKALFK
jgi:hypothetical protein